MKTTVLFFLLMVVGTACYSQKLLFHKKRYREVLYNVGDVLSFQLKGNRSKITARISGFEDSVIVFQDLRVNPKNITHLYVDSKTKSWYIFRYKYQKVLMYAGAGYLLLDFINTGEITKETLIISGSLISAAFMAKLLISDKIKINGRRRLVILR